MPLTTCGECNGQVSTAASACPHCGAPVATAESISTASPSPGYNENEVVYRHFDTVTLTRSELRTQSHTIPIRQVQRVEMKSFGFAAAIAFIPAFLVVTVVLVISISVMADIGLKGLICFLPTLLLFLYLLAQVARIVYQVFLKGGMKELYGAHSRFAHGANLFF